MSEAIDRLISVREKVVVFVPTTNEVQRFIVSGAFDLLADRYALVFVAPMAVVPVLTPLVCPRLTDVPVRGVETPPEQFELWKSVFDMACRRLGHRSRSFELRVGKDRAARGRRRLDVRLPRKLLSNGVRALSFTGRQPGAPPVVGKVAGALKIAVKDGRGRGVRDLVDFLRHRRAVAAALDGKKPLRGVTKALKDINPLFALIPTPLLDPLCNDVLWACERLGIFCTLLQSGWDNMSSKGVIVHRPRFAMCWGPQSVEHARTIQFLRGNTIRALGAPHYEFLRPSEEDEIARFRADLGFPAGSRVVLFGGSFRQFDETAILRRLDDAIESGRFGPLKVVYRPHPWRASRKDEDDFLQQTWKHIVFDPVLRDTYSRSKADRTYLKRELPMFDMSYLALLLSSVDAVICPMSTLILEALILDRPTMAIAFGDGKHDYNPSVTAQMTHFQELSQSPAIVWCDDAGRFEHCVENLLQPGLAASTAAERKDLLDLVVTRSPGTYAERLDQVCADLLEPAARKSRKTRALKTRATISHAYHADRIAARYCGITGGDAHVPGYWMHGWLPEFHNIHPGLIVVQKVPGKDQGDTAALIARAMREGKHWVGREDQAEYLRQSGYTHVAAIGLPFAYLPPVSVQRIPGSLLVMPPHAHGDNHGLMTDYADAIQAISHRFSIIRVCLNESEFVTEGTARLFEERGLKPFVGVSPADPDSLQRLKAVMSSFEFMTTNGFGSHIAYAASCGARVSIYGPYSRLSDDEFARTSAARNYPGLGERMKSLYEEETLRRELPFLFSEPEHAPDLTAWGAHQIGADVRLSPDQLARSFEWARSAGPAKSGADHRELVAPQTTGG